MTEQDLDHKREVRDRYIKLEVQQLTDGDLRCIETTESYAVVLILWHNINYPGKNMLQRYFWISVPDILIY